MNQEFKIVSKVIDTYKTFAEAKKECEFMENMMGINNGIWSWAVVKA